ncbi:hypothetical protein OG393_30800 [Streptomyces sp. NBC_01216]|uniref:hypothetical protein n=1 Tax=Streptomyces sp. NBC_01216 TaxID=2903778 RepID=UPI002E12C8E0|nr:hypothetical protein OG393_30800 [Streptomyces sp. NBC_01216]
MNLTIWRGTGAHRAATKADLQAENAELHAFRTAADDFFLRLIEDRDGVYNAWQAAEGKASDAEIVVVCQQAQLEDAQAEIVALRAALANAGAVNVPPAHRDVDDGDHPTEPTGINVRPIWDALGASAR